MRYKNDVPIYFRIPENLKNDFDFICKTDRMTMTQILNTFIRGFVESKCEENPKVYNRASGWSIAGFRR